MIISVGSLAMVNAKDRRQGLIDALLDRPFDRAANSDPADATVKGDQYTVVATVLDGGDPAKATTLIADSLKAHPNAKCVAGLFSYSGPAAAKAVADAGKGASVKVVCFDATDATQDAIAAGQIYSSVLQDQYRCGFETVRLLVEGARGGDLTARAGYLTLLPVRVVDKESLKDYQASGFIARTTSEGAPAGK